MSDLIQASLAEIRARLAGGDVSAEAVAKACLDRIAETEPSIHALITVREQALEEARALDAQGPDASKPLWGVPVTIKDAIVTKGTRTTAGSKILGGFNPFYDAFVVERLKEAGAVIVGKNNMDEFAMGSSTENSAFGPTRNPRDPERIPGGSSGGSAASVAANQCYASLGTDTGGSIRQPAALCGCVGLKPTYGRVSRYGVIAYGSSLDQVGPLTRTVEDAALVLSVIAGHDKRDSTSSPRPVDGYADFSRSDLKGVRLGVPREFMAEGLDGPVAKACQDALDRARALGADEKTIAVAAGVVDVRQAHGLGAGGRIGDGGDGKVILTVGHAGEHGGVVQRGDLQLHAELVRDVLGDLDIHALILRVAALVRVDILKRGEVRLGAQLNAALLLDLRETVALRAAAAGAGGAAQRQNGRQQKCHNLFHRSFLISYVISRPAIAAAFVGYILS